MKMYDIISHKLSGRPRLTGQYTIRLLDSIMLGSVCCNKHSHVTQLVIYTYHKHVHLSIHNHQCNDDYFCQTKFYEEKNFKKRMKFKKGNFSAVDEKS